MGGHLVDTTKCEHGFTDKYKKTFNGVGRNQDEKNESRRKFKANYDKIDWSKK